MGEAAKKEEELDSIQQLVDAAKTTLTTATTRLLSDFQNFRKEREAHLKIILVEFSKMNQDETKQFESVWSAYVTDMDLTPVEDEASTKSTSKIAALLIGHSAAVPDEN